MASWYWYLEQYSLMQTQLAEGISVFVWWVWTTLPVAGWEVGQMRFSLILLQLDMNCAWQNVLHFLEGRGEGPELTKPVLLTLEMLCSSYSLFFLFETQISIKSFEKLFSFSQFFKKHSQKFPCHHLYCFCPLYSDIIDWFDSLFSMWYQYWYWYGSWVGYWYQSICWTLNHMPHTTACLHF